MTCEMDIVGKYDLFMALMEDGVESVTDFWRIVADSCHSVACVTGFQGAGDLAVAHNKRSQYDDSGPI